MSPAFWSSMQSLVRFTKSGSCFLQQNLVRLRMKRKSWMRRDQASWHCPIYCMAFRRMSMISSRESSSVLIRASFSFSSIILFSRDRSWLSSLSRRSCACERTARAFSVANFQPSSMAAPVLGPASLSALAISTLAVKGCGGGNAAVASACAFFTASSWACFSISSTCWATFFFIFSTSTFSASFSASVAVSSFFPCFSRSSWLSFKAPRRLPPMSMTPDASAPTGCAAARPLNFATVFATLLS
mmetsp:Transcript_1039/g.2504  ORF Transcript_1039/g.2504 Transcript_1039/m.2504 type:complete len:244 (-) Transcript_1039:151-882(-)